MRVKLFTLFITMLLVACSSHSGIASQSKNSSVEKLMRRLQTIQPRGIMFGHQDDPVYGTTWKWEEGRSDVLEVCGDYPAVMGFDVGKLELMSKENIDGVPFDRMRREIQDQHRRGGIITISWHPWNPVTGENAWDPSGDAPLNCLPGGNCHEKFNTWLDMVTEFFNSITDDKGEPIPIIFRPWHEMTGGWFWWGCNSCSPYIYKQLFRYTHQYVEARTHNQLLWCYSPGGNPNETVERFMTYYPGDDCVDIFGVDIYAHDNHQAFINNMQKELEVLQTVGRDHHKPYTIAETGYRDTPRDDWFTQVLLPAMDGYQPLYVLLWRNAWDQPKENFGPAPEKGCAADFKIFHNDSRTLFAKDLK